MATGIREMGYRHWEGEYTSHAWRWWTIAWQAIRSSVFTKTRLVGLLLFAFFIWFPYVFFGILWFAGQFTINQGLPQAGLQDVFRADKILRDQLYRLIQGWQVVLLPMFVAMIGAPLVASDLRSNALYIYLAKPLRRVDYMIGKGVGAVVWALIITVLPNLFVILMALSSGENRNQLREPGKILFEVMVTQVLILVVVVSAVLALSSLTKRWWVAFATFVGIYYLSWILSQTMQGINHTFRNPNIGREWMLASPATNIINVSRTVLEMTPHRPPAWETSLFILGLMVAASVGVFIWRILKLQVAE